MRKSKFYLFFIILLIASALILVPAASMGKTKKGARKSENVRYVSDNLAITMRSGKSNEHRIIRSLDSGTKLRVLSKDKNYTKVRTEKGDVGWVLSRYLVNEPVARIVLPPIKEKLAKLETQLADLRKSYTERAGKNCRQVRKTRKTI